MSQTPRGRHRPVMVVEALEALQARPGAVVVDGTVGAGGHTLAVLGRLSPNGRVIAIDRDAEALTVARARLADWAPQVVFVHDDIRSLERILAAQGTPRVDGVLADWGMSSLQVDDAARGFSFAQEGPLDMRMDQSQAVSAETLVNERSAEQLAEWLLTLGEERFAKRIAATIVDARRRARITTTTALARLVVGAVPASARHGRLHVATRTFQALRMAVNDERAALQEFLDALPEVLNPGGRAAVLTYHSGDDRLVKQAFAGGAREGAWRLVTKKPLRPTAAEVAGNPRARSARLRVVERSQ